MGTNVSKSAASESSKCPVESQPKLGPGCPVTDQSSQDCPHAAPELFKLDPDNNMRKGGEEQKMSKGQRYKLSTAREESPIPKGEFTPDHQKNAMDSSSWVYPSEQQFYNAMKRKGWKPREEDMSVVLAIHNHVNNKAWSEVLKWEQMHIEDCDCPKLVKFSGKPKELSVKARFRSMLGYSKPFDRHDWIVDRCGKEVRYIIDFYKGAPSKSSPDEVVAMYLDARPALDDWESFVDRIKMQFNGIF